VLGLRVGLPDDGSLPPSRTERRAYDLVAEGFGPGTNGPLIIATDPAGDPGALDRLVAAVAADPGIASLAPAQVDRVTGIATLVTFPTTGPQERATADTVARLRTDVLPTVVGRGPARAHVGGAAASLSDVGQRTSQRLAVFVAAVLALSFLLLMLVFRSILVPLKAVLLNLLSIDAAYGVMVAVFQWGWGGALIGLETTVPIVSFIPMFLFAILFGLSMDYEVFLCRVCARSTCAPATTARRLCRAFRVPPGSSPRPPSSWWRCSCPLPSPRTRRPRCSGSAWPPRSSSMPRSYAWCWYPRP